MLAEAPPQRQIHNGSMQKARELTQKQSNDFSKALKIESAQQPCEDAHADIVRGGVETMPSVIHPHERSSSSKQVRSALCKMGRRYALKGERTRK